MRNLSLWFTAPRELEIREEPLLDLEANEVLVQTLLTAISPGTEMLVYRGEFPRDLSADSSISALQGQLSYPLRYGYCAIGRVRDIGSGVDQSWRDQVVFSFQPHQQFFVVPVGDVQQCLRGFLLRMRFSCPTWRRG
jgi:NADPH:quinone reductase-like Zn-dependent oxidoreductase